MRQVNVWALVVAIGVQATELPAQPRPANPLPAIDAITAPLRILWIGNSYTYRNDLPRTLTTMALAAGENRVPAITAVLKGGQYLRGHAQRPDLPALIAQGWDYVVLQDQSLAPLEQPDSLVKYGTQLGALAKQAGATVLLYVTWPRRDTPQTGDAIAASYGRLAASLGATMVPVGAAWQSMRGAMPSAELYEADGSHPSPIGTYLAASVFYRALYGRPVTGLPGVGYQVRANRYHADSAPPPLQRVTLPADEVVAVQRVVEQLFSARK
jgi:hypothetical protein